MQIFKIKKDGFKEIRKKMLLRSIPTLLLALGAGIGISYINSTPQQKNVNVLLMAIPIAAFALGTGLYRGLNRQKALFESYTLTVTSNLITREQLNTPTISIYFNDIVEIERNKNGSFTIKGKDPTDLIGIPAQIEGYQRLEIELQSIKSIVLKDKVSFIEKYQRLIAPLTIGLMLCVSTVNNKIIVGLTGSALVALMVWSLAKIRNSKNVDSKTKQGTWWAVLVLASVIAAMVFKLTGWVDMQKH